MSTPKPRKRPVVWYDELTGYTLSEQNGFEAAELTGGRFHKNPGGESFLAIQTERGELIARVGDFVGRDQAGTLHVTRLYEIIED